ncbi:MAG: hypothetical protein PUA90_00635 [bacterium]|nr:hypothetical protein [bacterium]
MNNFLDFITRDIASKKTMITSMPSKTKTNKKKINTTIEEIEEKYKVYKDNVKNYLIVKSHSFEIKEDNKEYEKVKKEVISLEQLRFLLNPSNTYIEKLGFDELLYQINNFSKFNFHSLNDIINAFLDKFEIIGLNLKSEDFRITSYVNEYMSAFLDVRYKIDKKYDKVSEIFERIYWLNPDLINHLALNFKILIRKNAKLFDDNILKLQKKTMKEYNIKDYEECLEKLKNKYSELEKLEEETIGKIISLALEGSLDINHYFEDNKVRINAFSSIIPDDIDTEDEKEMDKIRDVLAKLKYNVEEYQNYIKFIPLFTLFKNDYKNLINDKNTKSKDMLNEIVKKEKELDKCNKVIFHESSKLFDTLFKNKVEKTKILANHYVNELMELYNKYDDEVNKDRIRKMVSVDTTVEDVLHLYYSFDYLKKSDIQKSYETNDYDEIIDISNDFDLYSMNPNNLIVKGIKIFDDYNLSSIIANKYKLNNLKIEESDISEENIISLYNKIKLILRAGIIDKSSSSVEKIWFMVQTKKILDSEQVENADTEEE